jgi:hypothetical protein
MTATMDTTRPTISAPHEQPRSRAWSEVGRTGRGSAGWLVDPPTPISKCRQGVIPSRRGAFLAGHHGHHLPGTVDGVRDETSPDLVQSAGAQGESLCSECRWFVVSGDAFGEQQLFALDARGVVLAFQGDAVGAVLGTGPSAGRHHQRAVGLRWTTGMGNHQLPGGYGQRREEQAAPGLGGVDLSGLGQSRAPCRRTVADRPSRPGRCRTLMTATSRSTFQLSVAMTLQRLASAA